MNSGWAGTQLHGLTTQQDQTRQAQPYRPMLDPNAQEDLCQQGPQPTVMASYFFSSHYLPFAICFSSKPISLLSNFFLYIFPSFLIFLPIYLMILILFITFLETRSYPIYIPIIYFLLISSKSFFIKLIILSSSNFLFKNLLFLLRLRFQWVIGMRLNGAIHTHTHYTSRTWGSPCKPLCGAHLGMGQGDRTS